MATVISVENLGKKYQLSHQARPQDNYLALRDVIADGFTGIGKRLLGHGKGGRAGGREEFWALKDVSFQVEQGDRVGIIGRNGAGKSTLLKILSRITEPTSGEVRIRGRVASLLEVGSGFHPELTGRENIFLNGAILGMGRNEIRRKFDEIVAFAEIEKFLDTPVKRYSSGMYVRLAFAVAAHLDPEILIVDEVLAVGDAQFQKKCLGKMEEVSRSGRTLLFVSHHMDMVRALCSRCLLVDRGRVLPAGDPSEMIANYLNSIGAHKRATFFQEQEDPSTRLQVVRGRVLGGESLPREKFDVFEEIVIELEYRVYAELTDVVVNFELKRNGATLFLSFDSDTATTGRQGVRAPGLYRSRVKLPCPLLKSGWYSITINTGIVNTCTYQRLEDVLSFDVELLSKPSSLLSYAEKRPGVIAVPLDWDTEMIEEHRQ